jgi:pimeloyl-ACP methyl ester carboxylesterase
MANNQKLRYSVSRPVIGGAPQAVLTMDDDAARPVLLILHGGPGEAMAPFTQALSALEERFVVCLWEQRGAGLSYACGRTPEGLSLSRFVSDAVEVTEYLLKRFGRKKLVLMGFSWGSLVGILAASKAPSLYSAYIGVGQIADQRLSERDAYAQTLEKARRAGDQGSVAPLEKLGPPP